ncbi:MAG: hypothetical protein U9532_01145 ['Conium maculatum' witches'-broom phytoplasma]|nr:hypothetical protein ['Conium maculatum' witches'-broom phytoplasma]
MAKVVTDQKEDDQTSTTVDTSTQGDKNKDKKEDKTTEDKNKNKDKKVSDTTTKDLSSVLTTTALGEVACADSANPTTDEVTKAIKAKNSNVDTTQVTVVFDSSNKTTKAKVKVNAESIVYNQGSVDVTYTTSQAAKSNQPWYKNVVVWVSVGSVSVVGTVIAVYYVNKNKKSKK